MTTSTKTQPVKGFKVKEFKVKKDTLELALKADKDDVKAGTFDLGDVLAMLELHSTSDYDVELTLVKREE